uniref:Ig-like domain-containing protein n=3 Tax=Dendroctonus ponderosae TaxID=77166 RepID=A0AAR5P519_DENPD
MSLRAMHLNVPRAVRVGHSVTLGCQYDLEGAALYSVKWYRDQVEFYRFVPKEEPPIRVFPIDGIRVDVSVSNANNVSLLAVERHISGQFQCEVSADAPSFHTQSMSLPMTVAVAPVGIPMVLVDKTGLDHGRPLIADCHAPPSHPAANITFFVNDEKVPGYTSEWSSATPDQLEERTARLELTGVGGSWEPLRIRCEAAVFRLYRSSSAAVEVKPDTPQPASVLLLETSSKGSQIVALWGPFSLLSMAISFFFRILLPARLNVG